jgi:thiazole synthase
MSVSVNGETRRTPAKTIAALVHELELDPAKVAVERNGEIVPRSTLAEAGLSEGDVLEIVHFVGGGDHGNDALSKDSWPKDTWEVAGHKFTSRLIVGTGKYKDFAENAAALG